MTAVPQVFQHLLQVCGSKRQHPAYHLRLNEDVLSARAAPAAFAKVADRIGIPLRQNHFPRMQLRDGRNAGRNVITLFGYRIRIRS